MEGARKIFADQWPELRPEDSLDIFPSEYADSTKVEDIKNFLKKYL